MLVVKQKVFVNESESTINEFLSKLPAENIVSTHFYVHGYQNNSDEWTTIFYKEATA